MGYDNCHEGRGGYLESRYPDDKTVNWLSSKFEWRYVRKDSKNDTDEYRENPDPKLIDEKFYIKQWYIKSSFVSPDGETFGIWTKFEKCHHSGGDNGFVLKIEDIKDEVEKITSYEWGEEKYKNKLRRKEMSERLQRERNLVSELRAKGKPIPKHLL